MTQRNRVTLFIGTRRGLFRVRTDAAHTKWDIGPPQIEGHEIAHVCAHPTEPERLYAAANHNIWGAHVYASDDAGASWDSASANLADPRLSRRSTWYGPGGGVLGRVRLAPVLALELRYAGAVDLSNHGDSGARSSTELAFAFKPAPALTLRAGLAQQDPSVPQRCA